MEKKFQVPLSTYRMQFSSKFTWKQATELVSYLSQIGITHCYASPFTKAHKGTTHGYDVVDPSQLNAELGTEQELNDFIQQLHKQGMGLILDIVPNHMYIADPENKWWSNIFENGPSSPYADYFDIDWHPPSGKLDNKVLLPLLDQPYGDALENQKLRVTYQNGAFLLELPFLPLPTDPKSWLLFLNPLAKEAEKSLGYDNPHFLEFQSILTAITHLPSTTELDEDKVTERQREKEVIKKRLQTLLTKSAPLAQMISQSLQLLNGRKEEPTSFDKLEEFLELQPYRLCFWRVANDEINFRRFFDIFEYAGIKTEKEQVFEAIHSLILQLIEKKYVDGLRIDHIDGLWNPQKYLENLQMHCQKLSDTEDLFFVIIEKILTGNEKINPEWPVKGTVGYDFLNQVNGLFVFQENKKKILNIYRNFTGVYINTFDLLYNCKKLILLVALSSELYLLARHLDKIAAKHRNSRDFTAESLRMALRDVMACFPVYRSYISPLQEIHEEDQQYIFTAIIRAKRLNPSTDPSIFDFIQDVLLLKFPVGLEEEQKRDRENFVMHFQQLTAPVTAKGFEDTALYRVYPLSSLNEVGMDPYSFGTNVEDFHNKNIERKDLWPQTLLSTSTHDTKRSEDVRARIHLLSEIPEEWEEVLLRWSKLNTPFKAQSGDECIPDANEEYLIYQTLLGSWPLNPMDKNGHQQYVKRIQDFMRKALNEAKIHTSWINPNKDYENAIHSFIETILNFDKETPFLKDFKIFAQKISFAGMLNSLAQLLLKGTSPGIPDIYQGNEIWDFSLVDPDNRRPVDYTQRKQLLENLNEHLEKYLSNARDGRIKLFLTVKILHLRQRLSSLFLQGSYVPLFAKGERENHIIAFARILNNKIVMVITARFFSSLLKGESVPPDTWKNTKLMLPKEIRGKFRNILTDQLIDIEKQELDLEKVLNQAPFAILESEQDG